MKIIKDQEKIDEIISTFVSKNRFDNIIELNMYLFSLEWFDRLYDVKRESENDINYYKLYYSPVDFVAVIIYEICLDEDENEIYIKPKFIKHSKFQNMIKGKDKITDNTPNDVDFIKLEEQELCTTFEFVDESNISHECKMFHSPSYLIAISNKATNSNNIKNKYYLVHLTIEDIRKRLEIISSFLSEKEVLE